MGEEKLHLVVVPQAPPRTPSRKPPAREGHYGIKCVIVGLSVVAVVAVCFAVRFWPLPSSPPQPDMPSHRIVTANPIIGILSQPSRLRPEAEFIASSYIKWVESAGGRAVRIPFNASDDDVAALLGSVNGVLFPGGGVDPNRVASFIYNHAIALNRNGTHFPLWGTCLGMEWLLQLESRNMSILDAVDADNISSTLEFTPGAARSKLFGYSAIFNIMATQPIADYFHSLGILADHFHATASLTSFFRPLATSVDRRGQVYVAAIEAIEFPFYGVQFHPEKNAYELGEDADGHAAKAIDHTYNAILTSQTLAHFFINEARQNNHRFPTAQAKRAALLYNRESSDLAYPMFEEVLLFNSTF